MLPQSANCVLYLNRFWREVQSLHLSHDKKDSGKTVHNLQLKDQSGALHSPFHTIKALNRKLTIIGDFFLPPLTEQESLVNISLSATMVLLMKLPIRALAQW